MNDMDAIRRLLSEPPPPSPGIIQQAEQRLAAEYVTPAGPVPVRRPSRRRVTSRHGLGLGLGLGLVATAAATSVAIATLGNGAPASRKGQQVEQENLAPGSVLLAAAASSAKAPPTTGTYWLRHEQFGVSWVVGNGADRYVIERRTERKQWRAVAPRKTVSAERGLGTRPQTSADVAVWRRTGAPSEFPRGWPAKGTPWKTRTGSTADDGPFPKWYLKELQNLPADPGKVRAYLLKEQKEAPGDRNAPADRWLFFGGAELLVMPVSPKVRAATYEMLAAIPGIRTVGKVTDPLGRPGIAIGMHAAELAQAADELTETQLIVSPSTGALLAKRTVLLRPASKPLHKGLTEPISAARPGTVLSYQAYVTNSWTDHAP